MRNLIDVIDQIINEVPKTEQELIDVLKDIQESVRCAAPELISMWWTEVQGALLDNLPGKPTKEWQYKILSI